MNKELIAAAARDLAEPAAKAAVGGGASVFAAETVSMWLGLIAGALTVIYMLGQISLLVPKHIESWRRAKYERHPGKDRRKQEAKDEPEA